MEVQRASVGNAPFDRGARRRILAALGLFCAPVVLFSGYLLCSRALPSFFPPNSDTAFLGLSAVAGAAFAFLLPIPRLARVVVAIVYVPLACGFLFLYALEFVCTVFGDCL
jgi:hypothetical protein